MKEFTKRLASLQEKMNQEAFDFTLIGPSANMRYLTGLQTSPDERLQLLVIPESGMPVIVIPEMYLEKVKDEIGDQLSILAWSDQDNPYQLAFGLLQKAGKLRIAVDDTLRADHLLSLMAGVPEASIVPASVLTDSLRIYKDGHEIGLMTEAAVIADQLMNSLQEEIRPGVTEKELALYIEFECKRLADEISFKPIVAAGPNGALPHHSPGNRGLQEGDMVVIDCGVVLGGYCSDITRTFCLGKATNEMKEVHALVCKANAVAFELLEKKKKPSCEEIDAAARTVIAEAGYGLRFIHRLGHGIGLDIHEAPYLVNKNSEPLLEGMVFTIEPGIYLPGKFGVRIEDMVVITGEEPRRLTSFTRVLQEI